MAAERARDSSGCAPVNAGDAGNSLSNLSPYRAGVCHPRLHFPYCASLSLMMAPEMIPIEGEGQRKRVVCSIYIFWLARSPSHRIPLLVLFLRL